METYLYETKLRYFNPERQCIEWNSRCINLKYLYIKPFQQCGKRKLLCMKSFNYVLNHLSLYDTGSSIY